MPQILKDSYINSRNQLQKHVTELHIQRLSMKNKFMNKNQMETMEKNRASIERDEIMKSINSGNRSYRVRQNF